MKKFLLVAVIMAVMIMQNIVSASTVKWSMPTDGAIIKNFGFTEVLRYNAGIDIEAKIGSPIRVVEDGTVEEASYDNDYGLIIRVGHKNGIKTLYAHCSVLKVTAGDEVKVGDIIALTGDTGTVYTPHLHFEVQENNVFVNPRDYLR